MKEFDLNLVTINAFGVPISGYADDSVATIAYDGAAFTQKKGLDGTYSRSKVPGRSALLTIKLMNTSQSNFHLSTIHNQDLVSDGGAGVGAVFIKDGNGNSIFGSDEAYIEVAPDKDIGAEAGPREWKIRVNNPIDIEAGT